MSSDVLLLSIRALRKLREELWSLIGCRFREDYSSIDITFFLYLTDKFEANLIYNDNRNLFISASI